MTITVPLRLPSLMNARLHWRALNRVKVNQQALVWAHLVARPAPPLPATITLTRVGKRRLDDDNLAAAFKYVRDQIAAWVGVDDGDGRYRWEYRQEVGSQWAVRIDVAEV